MIDGKSEFYRKAEQSFIVQGYEYYDGDRDIPGKGAGHASKPDYIATKKGIIIIGEIKSPKEGPKSSSWRQRQPSDSNNFKNVRQKTAAREKSGETSPEIGGHEIIIRGQIVDYIRKIGITYELPKSISKTDRLLMGYTFPKSEEVNVLQALKNCKKSIFRKIDIGNGAITFTFY
jgi:hypothetical protein